MLLLHGTPSPVADWAPLAERLATNFHVIIPALPGYGASPAPRDATMEAIGDAIAAMLARRGVHALRGIVGFSTGAYRALELVLRGRVPADVIIALGGMATFDDAGRALRLDLAQQIAADPDFFTGADAHSLMRQLMLSPAWADAHPEHVAEVIAWPSVTTTTALVAELRGLARSRDLRPELPALRARVYLRVGQLDVACPPAWSEEIATLVPRASVDVVPGCGHALLLEDRAATVAAIARELERG